MRWIQIIGLLLLATLSRADERPAVLIVIGAEGSAEYRDVFEQSARRWEEAAKRGGANAVVIGRGAESQVTDKEQLQKAVEAQIRETKQPLWLVMIGHGTFDGKEAKFNLRGPDVSDAELAKWLAECKRPLAAI